MMASPRSPFAASAARRARATLAWGLLCFTGAQLAYLVVLERWRADLRDPEYGCKLARLRACLAAGPDRPLLLALGSSRTDLGFRPDVLHDLRLPDGREVVCFNFGLTGAEPLEQLVALNRLLGAGVRPRWVLIEIRPTVLQANAAIEDALAAECLSWSDLGRIRSYCSRPAAVYARWGAAAVLPCFSHRLCFMSRYAPDWLPRQSRLDYIWNGLDANGWFRPPEGRAAPGADPHQNASKRAAGFAIGVLADGCLRELVALCRREGIGPVFVVMPEATEFRSAYPPGSREPIDAYLTSLSRNCQVPLIDARDWIDDRDFFDTQHLLAEGGRRFTERLGREVLEPMLAGCPVIAQDADGTSVRVLAGKR
jgi:hypothetical protein